MNRMNLLGAVFWFSLALHQARSGGGLLSALLAVNSAWVGAALVVRNAPRAQGTRTDHLIAYGSACLPVLLDVGNARVGYVLTVFGTLLGLWALWGLRTAFGIAPAHRGLVVGGPYRLVRHPMYLAALMAALGAAWGVWSLWNGLVLGLLGMTLGYRIRAEEHILGADYRAYRARVRWRMVPFVW